MNNQGLLVVVSGFSGAGKGTLMKALLNRYDNYTLSISATTRGPRAGEEHGLDYFFVSQERFKEMIGQDELIEHAQYVNNFYGTPKDYVYSHISEGRDVILEIEMQGALKVKEKYDEAVLLFVMPPSANELRRRLISRGTESMEVIEARLKRALEEADGMEYYDYILINDDIDSCVKRMHQIIQSQHSKASNNMGLISQMKEELENM